MHFGLAIKLFFDSGDEVRCYIHIALTFYVLFAGLRSKSSAHSDVFVNICFLSYLIGSKTNLVLCGSLKGVRTCTILDPKLRY